MYNGCLIQTHASFITFTIIVHHQNHIAKLNLLQYATANCHVMGLICISFQTHGIYPYHSLNYCKFDVNPNIVRRMRLNNFSCIPFSPSSGNMVL